MLRVHCTCLLIGDTEEPVVESLNFFQVGTIDGTKASIYETLGVVELNKRFMLLCSVLGKRTNGALSLFKQGPKEVLTVSTGESTTNAYDGDPGTFSLELSYVAIPCFH